MTHVKLGLFAIATVFAATVVVVALGLHQMHGATVTYHTYFDESVQGLDVGASVKYRGVPIGTVSDIAIAPDRVHVDVALALRQSAVDRLDLASVPPGARAQLGTQGITGVKSIDIDFFAPGTSAAPELPFVPAERTIASRPSLLHGLAANLDAIGEKLPGLIGRGSAALAKLEQLVDELRSAHVGARLGNTLAGIDRAAARVDAAIGEVGRATVDNAPDLGRALRELADAARGVRELADAIARDPSMLVTGRVRSKQR